MLEQRHPRFTEKLTKWMLILASLGCGVVILEPSLTVTLETWGLAFRLGGGAFSDEMRGGVLTVAIIGSIVAIHKFWLGGNDPNSTVANMPANPPPTGGNNEPKP